MQQPLAEQQQQQQAVQFEQGVGRVLLRAASSGSPKAQVYIPTRSSAEQFEKASAARTALRKSSGHTVEDEEEEASQKHF